MKPEISEIIKKSVICLLAGASLTFAFAPYHVTVLPFLSIALLFYLWYGSSPKAAFVLGYFFGFGLFGTGVNWLHISINLFGGVNLFFALILTYLLVAFLALYPAVVGFISREYFQQYKTLNLLLFLPSVWTISEWCRSWIFTGFPWLNMGYSQLDTPLKGLAPITGVYGISWMVYFTAAVIIFLLNNNTKKIKLILSLVLILVWTFCGLLNQIDWTSKKDHTITVTLVQGGIPQQEKWKKENQQMTRDLYISLSKQHLESDIIIWPETAIPALYHQAEYFIKPILKLSEQYDVEVLTGIPVVDTNKVKFFNSIVLIGNDNEIYHKRHLVPFGEYLPFDKWLRPLLNYLHIPMSNFSAGNSEKPIINAAGQQIGVSICYEDVFGEEVIDALPEASFLINISNDAWFGDSLAPHQHLQMAAMRALETGRFMVRVTNTGISAIINNKGNILSKSPQFEPYVYSDIIDLYKGSTPYSVYGNYLIIIFTFTVLIIGILIRNKK